jgi:hypothetical protein
MVLAAAGEAVQSTVEAARMRMRTTPSAAAALMEARNTTELAFDNLRTKVVTAGQLQQYHQERDAERRCAAQALARAVRKSEAVEETAARQRAADRSRDMERAAADIARSVQPKPIASLQGGSCCS